MKKSFEEFKKLPIVMISMSRWDGYISSASWSLAKEFGKSTNVYYVDYPYTWTDYWRERGLDSVKSRKNALLSGKEISKVLIQHDHSSVKSITPPLVLPINWASPGWLYNQLSRLNNSKVASAIGSTLQKDGISEFIFWNSFNPSYLYQPHEFLNPVFTVYHSRDAITAINEFTRKHGQYLEVSAIQSSDLAIATSRSLSDDLSKASGKTVHLFANGGDTDLFKMAWEKDLEMPQDIKSIPGPMVGYTGNVCQRIDYELLLKLAQKHVDKSFVLVGPREDKQHTTIDLDAIPNIYFTGPKKLEQLPSYLKYFDVVIIPFKCNELTRNIYPLKINEYLAAGKSVVTTSFSPDIQSFKEVVTVAESHDTFIESIDHAILNNSDTLIQLRYEQTKMNSWAHRVDLFWDMAYETYLNT
ncbi:MAG: glycosyltransferase [Mongoliitalea sp.]